MAGQLPPARPSTPGERRRSLEPVTDSLGSVLGLSIDLFTDRPGFIASTDSRDPLGTAVRALSQLNCRRWAAADKTNFSQRVNQGNAQLCAPYLEGLGEKPDDGSIGPPFLGGQCDGVDYLFDYSFTDQNGVRQTVERGTNRPLRGTYSGVINDLGFQEHGFRDFDSAAGTVDNRLVGVVFEGQNPNPKISNVRRVDGQPDDCGNVGDETQPPATVTPTTPVPDNITINLPGIGDTTINLDLSPEGNPVICTGDFEACITVPIGGGNGQPGEGGDGGDGGPPNPPPGDIGEPGEGVAAGEGGDAEGEAPEGSVVVGVQINVVSAPSTPTRFTDVVLRGVCYVYMGVTPNLDLHTDGSMLKSGQFVFAEKDNLTSWRVSANTGYNLLVIPFYREIEE